MTNTRQTNRQKRPKRRPPQQQRSQQTLQNILEATESLLQQQPLEKVTVRQIVEAAGVSTGSFYARFDGKEALIEALWQELKLTTDNFLDDLPADGCWSLKQRIEMLMQHRVARYVKYRGLFRAFAMRARLGVAPFSDDDRHEYMASQKQLVRFLMESSEEIAHSQPRKAIIMAEFATAATARSLILYPTDPHASTIHCSRKWMTAQLAQMFLAYLT